MPKFAAYVDPRNRQALLAALRRGEPREVAASQCGGVTLTTLLGWIDRDPVLAREVEDAEKWGATARRSAEAERERDRDVKPDKAPKPDRLASMREEAAALGPGLYGLLLYVDGILSARGFNPLSPWWRWSFERFYASGKRWFLLRVGRGGGKSSTLCRPVVVECLFGPHQINPGEVGIWPLLSTDMDEANLKVGIVCAVLDVLGIEYAKNVRQGGRTRIGFSDAEGRNIEVRVYPATVNAISGPTLAGATNDEEAKWKHDSTAQTNNATEVLDALAPAFRARDGTHGFRCSSAWQTEGPHYEDVEAGDTDLHHVARIGEPFLAQVLADLERVAAAERDPADAALIRAYAATLTADSPNVPTWLANPSIDALATRREARNVRVWLREYASQSSTGDEGTFFDAYKIADAEAAPFPAAWSDGPCFAALDTGSKKNACALAIVRRVQMQRGYAYLPVELREWIPTPGRPLDLRLEVLPAAARLCRLHGCDEWVTDAHAGDQVEIVGGEHGITTRYTGPDPFGEFYRDVRAGMHRGEVVLRGPALAAEAARQMRLVRSASGAEGRTRIIVPEEKGDGTLTHGDLGVAIVRALGAAGCGRLGYEDDSDPPLLSVPGRYAGCR